MTPATPRKSTSVRLPVELHKLLVQRARENDRTMTKEIERLLREAIRLDDARKAKR
jgi:hypothetical protein